MLLRGWAFAERPERTLDRLVRAFRAHLHALVEAVADLLAARPQAVEDELRDVRRRRARLNQTPLLDTCVSNGGNMFGTMRITLATQRALDNQEPGASDRPAVTLTSRDVLSFATIDGARACGLDHKVGSLTPGKQADIVLLAADTPVLSPVNNPVGQVVYAAHPALVDTAMVAGRFVKRRGAMLAGSPAGPASSG